jgi:peroxiredoxin
MLRNFVDQLGMTYPVLLDTDGSVFEEYRIEREVSTAAYPHDWVVGTDGLLVYGSARYRPDELAGAVEAELER